ncbi:unnamed protein product, partial [Brassica oleracea]
CFGSLNKTRCLGYSFPCLGLVSGDFYVFRRLQYFTDVSFLR